MPNCWTCSDQNTCLTCQSGFYVNSTSSKCARCNIPNCFTCSNESTCLTCLPGSYMDSTSKCVSCNIIPNCMTCSDQNKCLSCQVGYYITYHSDGSFDKCVGCSSIDINCGSC